MNVLINVLIEGTRQLPAQVPVESGHNEGNAEIEDTNDERNSKRKQIQRFI